MAELQRSAALRAAKMNPRGGNILIRRGMELCLATNAVADTQKHQVNASTKVIRAKSAGQARKIEERFYAWLAMCGEAGPVAILAVVWRWIERIEELEREFMFWLERMPNAHRVVVLTHAIERLECALRVAHRRMGRRWDGRP